MIIAVSLIAFFLGLILGCHLTLPIVLQCIKQVNKSMYDKGCLDTLERFKNGNHKKNH